jgi:hypothetical protein
VLPVKFGRLLLKLEAGLVAGARNRQKISAGNSTGNWKVKTGSWGGFGEIQT